MSGKSIRLVAPCTLLFCNLACGEGAVLGSGVLQVTTYGEDYIEQEIPAADFTDGWKCVFEKFLIVLCDVSIAEHGGSVGGTMEGKKVFDMTRSGPHPVTTFEGIAARRWDEVSVSVEPAESDTTAGNSVVADDVELMKSNGYSVYAQGTLSRDAESRNFSWGFKTATEYADCQKAVEQGGELGVSVPDGGTATAQFTIHGDHFFYDDLAAADAVVRGQAIADADADSNGEITLDELAAVDLASLPPDQYGTGGAGDVDTLGDFVRALTRTLVHYQGEGHCHAHAR